MARAMAEADMADDTAEDMAEETGWTTSSETRPRRWSPWGAGKRLSDRTPLRTKLITAMLALVIMALAAIGVASVVMLRGYVTTQHDNDLVSVVNTVNATHRIPQHVTVGNAAPTQSNIVIGLQDPGSPLTWGQYNNLPAAMGNPDPLPSLPTTGLWTGQTVNNPSPVMSIPAQAGPNTWRVIAETVTVQDPTTLQDSTAILMVAEDLGNLNALTTRLVLFNLIVGGAIVVVLAAVGVGVVRANLRPLDDIELTAGQIAKGHLDHRVPEGDPRTEIGSLGRSLNAMLAQIERAFHAQGQAEQAAHQSEERMRRFIADAAHELRTPLTTIRGFAAHYRQRGGASSMRPAAPEQNSSFRTDPADSGPSTASPVAGSRQDGMSPQDLDHLVGRVEAEATRMGLLVEDLLTLARLDQQRPLAKAPVDLLTLAADAVQDARIVSPGRPIDLIVAPGTAFLVDGDEPRLRQVLANLVNNAITHTPAGTPVRVKIARGTLETQAQPASRAGSAGGAGGPAEEDTWGGSASASYTLRAPGREVPAIVLDVEDDGPGMSTEQAQRVFERFYRADAARNRASGGTGLGLAIVAGLVSAHGGTVSVRTAPGQGADFQVKLPLSPDALAVDDAEDELPA
jgi:two-component system, OmpR family, sensor kinase